MKVSGRLHALAVLLRLYGGSGRPQSEETHNFCGEMNLKYTV
jgi:hypothetical protein